MRGLLGVLAGGLALILGGCSWKASADDFTQAEVDAIADKCGAPRNAVMFRKGWVNLASPAEDDEPMTCFLRELKSTGKTKIQIVGNTLYTLDEG